MKQTPRNMIKQLLLELQFALNASEDELSDVFITDLRRRLKMAIALLNEAEFVI